MDKKLNEIHENLIPTKLTTIRIWYNTKSYNTIKHNIPYSYLASLLSSERATSSIHNIVFKLYSLDS